MLSKSATVTTTNKRTSLEDLKLGDIEPLKLPKYVQKQIDVKVAAAITNINSALGTIEKHCPDLESTIKSVKDRKLRIGIEATETNITSPQVLLKENGTKIEAASISIGVGLASLPKTKEEQAILVGAMVKSLTLAKCINANGQQPTSNAELREFQNTYCKNLTSIRDALLKERSTDSKDLAKGLEKVLKDASKRVD